VSTVVVSKYVNVEGASLHYLSRTRRTGYTGKTWMGTKRSDKFYRVL